MADLTNPKTRTLMRSLMADLGQEVALLEGMGTEEARTNRMQDLWKQFTTILDLGPEPEMAPCPKCGKEGRRDAQRCGYCWVTLIQ